MTILDTNVWVAYLSTGDSQHAKAQHILETAVLPILVPEYVVLEVCTVLSRINHGLPKSFIERVTSTAGIDVILSDEQFFHEVLAVFSERPAKNLSFVDIALLVLAKDYQVITFDIALKKALAVRS